MVLRGIKGRFVLIDEDTVGGNKKSMWCHLDNERVIVGAQSRTLAALFQVRILLEDLQEHMKTRQLYMDPLWAH